MTAQHQVKGLFFVITSGFFFGVACVISKILLNGGSTPLLLILSRNLFGAFCLGLFMFFYRRTLFRIDKTDVKTFILCGIVMFIYSAAYFFCLYYIDLSIAVMLLYLYPSMVAAASVFLYKEKLTFKLVSVLILTLLGLALTLNLFSTGFDKISLPGLILGLAAAVGAAGYCIYVKKLSGKYHAFTINFYGLICTVIGYTAMIPFSSLEPLSHGQLCAALAAAFPYISGFLFYSAGVKYLKPSFAAIFGNSEVVFDILLAFLILGEIFSFSQGIGMLLIIGAIVLLELPLKNSKNTTL